MVMDKKHLEELAKDQKYIPGIYNYCDRWCERCRFSSRCLNCTLEEEQFGDLEDNDELNEIFWKRFAEMLQDTVVLIKEMAKEQGIDLDAIENDENWKKESGFKERSLAHLINHTSKSYATSVDDWFVDNEHLFLKKEAELNRMRLLSSRENPTKEAISIADATEVIRWYQYQIHVKLRRATESAAEEELEDSGDFPKDSDGSAKVALIRIDRSISAWKIYLSSFPEQTEQILNVIASLENLRQRVEAQFPQARAFIRPGFDEPTDNG